MSVKNRLRLIVAVAAIGILALSAGWLLSMRSSLLAAKKEQARSLVAVPYSIILEQYQLEKQGIISHSEAQRRAVESLKNLRYNENNYFWINDMHPTMVMHPMRPDLDGKDLTTYKDPAGKTLFSEMVQIVKANGSGYLFYRWTKLEKPTEAPVPKLSFVRGFEPWGWIIGTGVYVDDIDAAWRADAMVAGGLGFGCLFVLVLVSTSLSHSIFKRLDRLVTDMGRVANGDLTCSEDPGQFAGDRAPGTDEIGVLVGGFRSMLEHIWLRDRQLRANQELLEDKVAERTAELANAQAETELFLECIPSILIGLDLDGHIRRWNHAVSETFGVKDFQGRTLVECGIKWLQNDMQTEVSKWLRAEAFRRCDDLAFEKDGNVRFVGLGIRPIMSKENKRVGFIVTGTDITERKCLEEQLRQAHKLEAIGQLAAGVAHEINTPTQFIGDNTTFLKESYGPIFKLLGFCRQMQEEAVAKGSISTESLWEFDQLSEQCDYHYLSREVPLAIDQSLEGLQRVAKIVRAMKEFSHPGSAQKEPVDLNRIVEATVTVARGEWKHVADVDLNLAQDLPQVIASSDEIKQVVLNLLINSAHAIRDVVGDGGHQKGQIKITSCLKGKYAEISIADTGTGIPPQDRSRVFEPFFTTKPVGSGTGQGLALAHSIVVKGHQGQIWFDSEVGAGTTFFIRLPLLAEAATTP